MFKMLLYIFYSMFKSFFISILRFLMKTSIYKLKYAMDYNEQLLLSEKKSIFRKVKKPLNLNIKTMEFALFFAIITL